MILLVLVSAAAFYSLPVYVAAPIVAALVVARAL